MSVLLNVYCACPSHDPASATAESLTKWLKLIGEVVGGAVSVDAFSSENVLSTLRTVGISLGHFVVKKHQLLEEKEKECEEELRLLRERAEQTVNDDAKQQALAECAAKEAQWMEVCKDNTAIAVKGIAESYMGSLANLRGHFSNVVVRVFSHDQFEDFCHDMGIAVIIDHGKEKSQSDPTPTGSLQYTTQDQLKRVVDTHKVTLLFSCHGKEVIAKQLPDEGRVFGTSGRVKHRVDHELMIAFLASFGFCIEADDGESARAFIDRAIARAVLERADVDRVWEPALKLARNGGLN